jgi:molecular chaperone GrpE
MARRHREDDQEEVYSVPIKTEEDAEGEETEARDVQSLLAEISVLQAELEEQRQKAEDEHNQHLRVMADFANYRRRREEEFLRHMEFANQELILRLLPVVDNFERAAEAAKESSNFDSLVEGVNLTVKQIKDILDSEGVKPIESVGEQFDPMKHEAVMRVVSDEYPENTIVEEVERGYLLKDRVIRPSRVAVSATE